MKLLKYLHEIDKFNQTGFSRENVTDGRRICSEGLLNSLRKKCPFSELFWSSFSRIRTEYGEISVRM